MGALGVVVWKLRVLGLAVLDVEEPSQPVPPSFVEPQPVMKHLAPSWKM